MRGVCDVRALRIDCDCSAGANGRADGGGGGGGRTRNTYGIITITITYTVYTSKCDGAAVFVDRNAYCVFINILSRTRYYDNVTKSVYVCGARTTAFSPFFVSPPLFLRETVVLHILIVLPTDKRQ